MRFLLSSLFAWGCSINGFGVPGTVSSSVTETEHIRMVRVRAQGLHAYTTGALGLHLGTIDRLLAYPVQSSATDHCASFLLGDEMPGSTVALAGSAPVHMEVRRAGGNVELARWALSFELGAGRIWTTRFSETDSLTFSYDNRNSEAEPRICAAVFR